ncbi:helix-turn-helix transcriptional regulator [Palleronia caenipelagi]|uniref:Helix-turn-helix transcriptional regulator n=2 Tax=Palleronia caenipelagi TaxID=2489174 RepID=A0A547Q7Y4_9RHOB|nr:helix-turn-helix transcriptional regulator [Palleronia caenipelagi]
MVGKAETVAERLTLLGNSRRLMILCRLATEELSVSALQAQLDLSQSALSQHLGKLREAGLVDTRREGQTIYYRLAEGDGAELMRALYGIYCATDETD